jgi:iron complex outermembrane recepter protein
VVISIAQQVTQLSLAASRTASVSDRDGTVVGTSGHLHARAVRPGRYARGSAGGESALARPAAQTPHQVADKQSGGYSAPRATTVMSVPRQNFRLPWLLLAASLQAQDLIHQSIEDLMNVEVTSASKKQQKISQTAAAVYVITQEDIRRSGATSLVEALRMVPGVDVARLGASQWAVSARGFNGRFSGKLLVLIDGRSVYDPLFSGVYWDVQDTMLEDVDRIEVIRGPGATIWGANAVNGVINVITKHTKDTQGTLISSGGGSEERGFGAARLGGKLGEKAHFRVYGKYFNQGPSVDGSGLEAGDAWSSLRGGFRVDSEPSSRDTLTVQGDIYRENQNVVSHVVTLSPPFEEVTPTSGPQSGGNLLGRWNRAYSNGSETTLQMYWDRASRENDVFRENIDTLDLDFNHHTPLGGRQDIVWGLGYRLIGFGTHGGSGISFTPANRYDQLFSAFVQDEITVVEDRLKITLGSKIEHNDYTRIELEPSVRVLWTPNERQSLWAAISRAVRTPSPADTSLRVDTTAFAGSNGTVNLLSLFGNPNFLSEKLLAYELGYRFEPSHRISLDFAAFFNDYDDLQNNIAGRPFFESTPQPSHLVIPIQFGNGGGGYTYGLEVAANWSVTSYWKWTAGYTALRVRLEPGTGGDGKNISYDSPARQWQVRSSLNLPHRLELDTALYYTGPLLQIEVPSYFRLDSRLGWRLSRSVDLSLTLQNLLDARHPEFNDSAGGVPSTQIRRSAYAQVTWKF